MRKIIKITGDLKLFSVTLNSLHTTLFVFLRAVCRYGRHKGPTTLHTMCRLQALKKM